MVLIWIMVVICGIGIILLARSQPKFPLGFIRRTRNLDLSIHEVFIIVLLVSILFIRMIANSSVTYLGRHEISFFVMIFYGVFETIGIVAVLVILIILDQQIFPRQQKRSYDEILAEEERIYYQKKGMEIPEKSAINNGFDEEDFDDSELEFDSGNELTLKKLIIGFILISSILSLIKFGINYYYAEL